MTLPLILVTGATGTLGTEMIRHLVKAGHRVRALVRHRPQNKLGKQKRRHHFFRGLWTSMGDYLFAASRITSATF